MEMIFNSDEGFITSSEEINLKLGIDDIMYYPIDYDDIDEIKRHHFIDLYYGFVHINKEKNKIKLIIPNRNTDDEDIVFNKNILVKLEKLKLFIAYYNYYKSCYFYNIQCNQLLNKAQKTINSKELYLNMDLYVTKKYFYEISEKLKSYKPLYISFLTVTQNKCNTNNKLRTLFDENKDDNNNKIEENNKNNDLKVIIELKKLFENIYDNLIDKEDNAIKDKNKNIKNKTNNIFISNEYQIENIDKIKVYYLNLIKILNELKRSFYERIISEKYDIYDINNIQRNQIENRLDICTRFYYIKFKDIKFKELNSMNEPLISENKKLKNENKKLISKLKNYIKKNNIQIYLCFRCGNLLFKSDKKESSNCNYDNNCFNVSFFFCKICQIYFCSYCIHYPKDFKCNKNHELTSLKHIKNIKNEKDKYMCDLCGKYELKNNISCCLKCEDTFVCKICKEEAEKTMLIKYKCLCGNFLFWRRGIYCICSKCKKFNNCFWICFFCKKFYCLICYKTYKNKCGLMHELKEICLDNNQNINLNQIKVKDLYTNKILIRFNCDICKNKFFSNFFYCSRCNFIKCYKCNK